MSRPGLGLGKGRGSRLASTTWALGARPAHAERATCAGCARHARDQLAVRAAAPTTWPLRATWVLGVHTVHPNQFCGSALFRVTVWTLFMDTVQEHCSYGKKRVQNS